MVWTLALRCHCPRSSSTYLEFVEEFGRASIAPPKAQYWALQAAVEAPSTPSSVNDSDASSFSPTHFDVSPSHSETNNGLSPHTIAVIAPSQIDSALTLEIRGKAKNIQNYYCSIKL
jgi:hypothetical protein